MSREFIYSVVVVICAFLVWNIWYLQPKQRVVVPAPPPEPMYDVIQESQEETTSFEDIIWRVYENEDIGVSFEYPSYLGLEDVSILRESNDNLETKRVLLRNNDLALSLKVYANAWFHHIDH